LENAIQRALVVAKGEAILPADLPGEIMEGGSEIGEGRLQRAEGRSQSAGGGAALVERRPDLAGLARTLFEWARKESKLKIIPAVERELVIQALAETKGNQVQAAKLLGITRATLRKRVDKFQIKQELEIK
jgi:two-component system nitrogen regulation response regulator GlnG